MHRFVLFIVCYVGLFAVSAALSDTLKTLINTRDEPSKNVRISRGSGTGVISFGYALVVLLALALFLLLMGVILCYKRDKGIRGVEEIKAIYLTRF